ncbi:histidine kinase, partial [Actinomycetes bacterium KLBMP 9797]
ALITYGLTRMARLVGEIHAAREELSRMAVAEERLRLARDVHDVLGLSLSAITLKSELTYRLIAEQPEWAREELADVLVLARRALTEVRMVASGRQELSLEDELALARSVLAAAGIDARIGRVEVSLPARVATVLATLVREGVTNVLRHSKARWCEIGLSRVGSAVVLDIVNDGVPVDPVDAVSSGAAGSGIPNMRHRIAWLGGELVAGAEDGGRHRLHATIPVLGSRDPVAAGADGTRTATGPMA